MLAAILLAQDAQLGRSGEYWVRTVDGTAGVPAQGRLQILTRGHIVLRGYKGNEVTYRLTERVKARSEADARRMFGSVQAVTRPPSEVTSLVVSLTSAPNVIIELEVNVPRRVTITNLTTRLGDIEAYDLEGRCSS